MNEVDIFIGNCIIIDYEVYSSWIKGFTVSDAAAEMQIADEEGKSGLPPQFLLSDVADHYRTFDMLEKVLINPMNLTEEWTFQLHPTVQKYLIEKYYEFTDVVIREFLGKKLSSRTRKDLDDVADKTGVTLRSCRRQFDNVKRILKQIDDMPGSVINNITSNFLLPADLSQKYAAIIFLMNVRFESSKRRLNYLSLDDFVGCAIAMRDSWTSADSEDDSELDRDFLGQLRDLKVVLEREKEHRNVVLSHLQGKISDKMRSEVESNFKNYSRSIVSIAVNLNNTRYMKDFFVDVVEKVIDPCKQAKWKVDDLETFLKVYTDTGMSLDCIFSDAVLKSTWDRYMTVMQKCIGQLYHS